MNQVTFIHTADLHLDSPFKGMAHLPQILHDRIKDSTFQSFYKIIEIAIQEKVDFILISGDLYDESNRSLKAQVKMREQFEKLAEHDIQVYLLHGNHDHLEGQWTSIAWPENVHFFSDQVECLTYQRGDKTLAHIYGFSYPSRNVSERMIQHYQKQEGASFHIGMLHGSIQGNTEHEAYAPFLVTELLEKEFDYWALGHIHKREVLNQAPPVIYPGNIQGRHRKEVGPKGAYLVTLSSSQAQYEFVSTAEIIWDQIDLDITSLDSADELLHTLENLKKEYKAKRSNVMLQLRFIGSGPLFHYIEEEDKVTEIVNLVFRDESFEGQFVWLVDWKNQTTPPWDRDSLKKEEHFISDLLQQIDSFEKFDEVLAPLYNHRSARKFLENLSSTEKAEVLKEAEQLLLNGILSSGGRDA